jgi:UDP-N-acetyl-D-mannosaminuronic acid transferase (WecB/TagA/CpsF family)
MLNSLLSKLFTGTREAAFDAIFSLYEKKGSALVHFLYFANIVLNGLEKKELSSSAQEYANALLNADILLPDGIALRLLAKKRIGRALSNLNGTDFLPFFLSKLAQSKKSSSIALYGASSAVVDGARQFLGATTTIPIVGTCDGFRELDETLLDRLSGDVRILLV